MVSIKMAFYFYSQSSKSNTTIRKHKNHYKYTCEMKYVQQDQWAKNSFYIKKMTMKVI